MNEPDTLKLRDGGVSWRTIDEEIVVLDLERSSYLSLNPTGSVLWRKLDSGTTVEELVEELMREFDVDRAVASADVDAFLRACREQHLLAG
jgi:hypothetical protein